MSDRYGPKDFDGDLAPLRRDAIYLHRPFPVPSALDDKNTYLGGSPRLPESIAWPKATNGRPMSFMAQIDCSDLPKTSFDLPEKGLLLFFASLDEDSYCEDDPYAFGRVVFEPKTGSPEREAPPDLTLPSAMKGWPYEGLRFRSDDVGTLRRWPLKAYLVNSWPPVLPDANWQEQSKRDYGDMCQRMLSADIFRSVGVAPDFQQRVHYWGRRGPYDPQDDAPFPQCWRIVDAITCAFVKQASSMRDLPYLGKVALKKFMEEAEGFLKEAQTAEPFSALPQARQEAFAKWVSRLMTTRHDAIHYDASDAVEMGMAAALRDAATTPESRAIIPKAYFEDLYWDHVPSKGKVSKGQTRVTTRIHQMLGHRVPGGSAPVWDTEDNVVLLQLYSDRAIPFLFGDGGYLQFCIHRDDLAARRFDRAFCLEDQ